MNRRNSLLLNLCLACTLSASTDPVPKQIFNPAHQLSLRLEKEEKWAELEALSRTQVGADPQDCLAWSGLGQALSMQGKHDEAIQAYRAGLQIQSHPIEWFRLGNAYNRARKPELAAEALRQAVTQNPNLADCWNNLGNTLADLTRFSEAIEAYNQALALKPKSPEWCLNLAQAYIGNRETEKGLHALNQALTIDPTFLPGWHALGITYTHLRMLDKAVQAYKEATALDPDDQTSWAQLGKIYLLQNRRPLAVVAWRQLLQVNPGLCNYWGNLGVVYDSLGQSQGVMECYERMKALDPKMAEEFNSRVAQKTKSL